MPCPSDNLAYQGVQPVNLVLADVIIGVGLELVAGGTARRPLRQLEQRRVDHN